MVDVDWTKVKYFNKDDCQKLGKILIDMQVGYAAYSPPGTFGNEKPICEITFDNLDGFSIDVTEADVDYVFIGNSKVGDVVFSQTDIDNLGIDDTNNVSHPYIHSKIYGEKHYH